MNVNKENDDKEMRDKLREYVLSKKGTTVEVKGTRLATETMTSKKVLIASTPKKSQGVLNKSGMAKRPSTLLPLVIPPKPKRPSFTPAHNTNLINSKFKSSLALKDAVLDCAVEILPSSSVQPSPGKKQHHHHQPPNQVPRSDSSRVNLLRRKLFYHQVQGNVNFRPVVAQHLEHLSLLSMEKIIERREREDEFCRILTEIVENLEGRTEVLSKYYEQVVGKNKPLLDDAMFRSLITDDMEEEGVQGKIKSCLELMGTFTEFSDLWQVLPTVLQTFIKKYNFVDSVSNLLLLNLL